MSRSKLGKIVAAIALASFAACQHTYGGVEIGRAAPRTPASAPG